MNFCTSTVSRTLRASRSLCATRSATAASGRSGPSRGSRNARRRDGRLTAGILTVLPLLTALALLGVAPGYLQGMAKDPDGKYMILGAGFMVLVGNYFIRRIIKIKV